MTQQESILLPYNYTIIYRDCIEWSVFMVPVPALMNMDLVFIPFVQVYEHWESKRKHQRRDSVFFWP